MSEWTCCYVVTRPRRGPLPVGATPEQYPNEYLSFYNYGKSTPVPRWTVFHVEAHRCYTRGEVLDDCTLLVRPDDVKDAVVVRWEIKATDPMTYEYLLNAHAAAQAAIEVAKAKYKARQES